MNESHLTCWWGVTCPTWKHDYLVDIPCQRRGCGRSCDDSHLSQTANPKVKRSGLTVKVTVGWARGSCRHDVTGFQWITCSCDTSLNIVTLASSGANAVIICKMHYPWHVIRCLTGHKITCDNLTCHLLKIIAIGCNISLQTIKLCIIRMINWGI